MSPNDLKILKKGNEVGKLWYLQWSHGITLGGCGKKLKMFRISSCVWFLQSETSPNKFHKVEKDPLGFSNNVTVELVLEFQTFCIAIREHKLQHGKISYFSGAVCYLLIFFWIFFAESFRGLLSAKALCREQLGPLSAQISFFFTWPRSMVCRELALSEEVCRELLSRFNFFLEISFFVQFAESYSRQIMIFIFFYIFLCS